MTIVSAILLAPFPLVFLALGIDEGLYLCAFSFLPLFLPIIFHKKKNFLLGRFLGVFLGINTFALGALFFGIDSGFLYGVMSMLVLPFLYFRAFNQRLFFYTVISAEFLLIWVLLRDQLPLFYELGEEKIYLHSFLFAGSSGLIIAYFISSDWINRSYEKQNQELVEKLTLRNEELKNFSYSTSHDLKQPLRTILNFVALFKRKKADRLDAEEQVFLNFIEESGNRLNDLIDALLQHSVLGQSEKIEEINTRKLVSQVTKDLKLLIEENNANVDIGHLPTIKGNQQEISAVFQNLITNAIKFKKEQQQPVIKIRSHEDHAFWKFSVEDNGVGIAPEMKNKIFGLFQKGHTDKKIQGTGIGLANCRKIVKLHSGEIWVNSTPNKGSTFYFTIKK